MKCPKCAQEMTPIIYPTMPPKRGYTCNGCNFEIDESDIFELKLKEFSPPKFRCATCDNDITELRSIKFPICDECLNDMREIISERRKPKVVEIGGVEYMERRNAKR